MIVCVGIQVSKFVRRGLQVQDYKFENENNLVSSGGLGMFEE